MCCCCCCAAASASAWRGGRSARRWRSTTSCALPQPLHSTSTTSLQPLNPGATRLLRRQGARRRHLHPRPHLPLGRLRRTRRRQHAPQLRAAARRRRRRRRRDRSGQSVEGRAAAPPGPRARRVQRLGDGGERMGAGGAVARVRHGLGWDAGVSFFGACPSLVSVLKCEVLMRDRPTPCLVTFGVSGISPGPGRRHPTRDWAAAGARNRQPLPHPMLFGIISAAGRVRVAPRKEGRVDDKLRLTPRVRPLRPCPAVVDYGVGGGGG